MNKKTVFVTVASCLMTLMLLVGCADNKRESQQTQTTPVTNDKVGFGSVVGNASTETLKNYIGNKNSQVLHVPTCDSLPYERNRVFFGTIDEALNQGYRKHYECMGK